MVLNLCSSKYLFRLVFGHFVPCVAIVAPTVFKCCAAMEGCAAAAGFNPPVIVTDRHVSLLFCIKTRCDLFILWTRLNDIGGELDLTVAIEWCL